MVKTSGWERYNHTLNLAIILLIMIPLFFNFFVFSSLSGQHGSRQDDFNHFQFLEEKTTSGGVRYLDGTDDGSKIVIKTSNMISIIDGTDFKTIANFSSNPYKGLCWDHQGLRLADGDKIRRAPSFEVETVIYGDSFSWSPNGDRLASLFDFEISIWNMEDYSIIERITETNYTAVEWGPGGNYLAAAYPSYVDIYNSSDLNDVQRIDLKTDKKTKILSRLSWSPDAKYLAYNSRELYIQLIDMESREVVENLYGFTSDIYSFDWSPDGRHLIVASSDGVINLYDMEDLDSYYQLVMDDYTHPKGISFLGNNYDFVVGTSGGTVEHWRFKENEIIAEAGPDRYALVDDSVSFDGSLSVGNITPDNYRWTLTTDSGEVVKTGINILHRFSEPGEYDVTLNVTDELGRSSEDTAKAYIFNYSHRPKINITFPENYSILKGIVIIEGDAWDDIGVRKVQIRINDGNWLTATGTEDWTYKLDTRQYTNGINQIEARALDDAQVSSIIWAVYEIRNGEDPPEKDPPPTIQIIEPADNDVVSGQIIIKGLASDNTYVRSVELNFPDYRTIALGSNSWYLDWDTTPLPDGIWTIEATAYDEFGQSSSDSIDIRINNTGRGPNEKPEVGIIYPTNGTNVSGIVRIEGWAEDDRELRIVQVRVNSSIWRECDGLESWTYIFNSVELTDGPMNITARAFDGEEFSDPAKIVLYISNGKNKTNGELPDDTPPPTSTYVIEPYLFYLFLIIIILSIIVIGVFWDHMKRYKWVGAVLIAFLIILAFSTIPENETPNDIDRSIPDKKDKDQNNTTKKMAPDFTMISLKDGSVITNEDEIGNVVLIFFTHRDDFDSSIDELNKLYIHYKENGVKNFHAIVLNYNKKISERQFNETIQSYYQPDWHYALDKTDILHRYGLEDAGHPWILIDTNGTLVEKKIDMDFDYTEFKNRIDPLL